MFCSLPNLGKKTLETISPIVSTAAHCLADGAPDLTGLTGVHEPWDMVMVSVCNQRWMPVIILYHLLKIGFENGIVVAKDGVRVYTHYKRLYMCTSKTMYIYI